MKNIVTIVFIFLIWRLLLFLPLFYAQTHIPWQKDSAQYILWAYTKPYPPVNNFLLYPWANFDGVHYLTIATDGGYFHGSDGRFFPLYPFVARFFILIFGTRVLFGPVSFFSAFYVANGAFFLALFVLYKLIRLDYSEKTALQTILFLLVFPVSFFFGSLYSESTFLLLSVSIFYLLRKYKFFFATILSMALLVTRVIGIAIIPILIYEMLHYDKHIFIKENFLKHKKKIVQHVLLILLVPAGLLVFIWFNQHFWGDPFFFLHAQEHVVIGRSAAIVFFPQTVFRYIKILISVSHQELAWWISLLELSSFFFAAILCIYAFIKKIPPSYIFFSLFCFLIPTQSGTFNGLPRYVSVLFPLFLTLALVNNKYIKVLYVISGILLSCILLALFSKGYFIS